METLLSNIFLTSSIWSSTLSLANLDGGRRSLQMYRKMNTLSLYCNERKFRNIGTD